MMSALTVDMENKITALRLNLAVTKHIAVATDSRQLF